MNNEAQKELSFRNTVHKLIITMKKHKKLFDSMREKTGLGRSDHRLLMILSASDETPSQRYIAERLEISTAAVAVMLKKLESDGYIRRSVNQNDSRFNSIELTEKGAEITEASKKDFLSIDVALFDGFEEKEMLEFNAFLDRLQANIEKIEGGSNS